MPRVLVVEADPEVRTLVVQGLRRALFPDGGREAFRIEAVSSTDEAVERLRRRGPAIVVCGVAEGRDDGHALRQALVGADGFDASQIVYVESASGADVAQVSPGAISASLLGSTVGALLRRQEDQGPA